MNYEQLIRVYREADKAMLQQSEYDAKTKMLTTKCAICNIRIMRKKQWFRSWFSTYRLLRMEFNFCQTCNRWVCGDCHLVDDGNGNGIGICAECADKKGITGLTIAQFEEVWPVLRLRMQEKQEASHKAYLDQEKNKKSGK